MTNVGSTPAIYVVVQWFTPKTPRVDCSVARKAVTFDAVRKAGLRLPGVEE